MRFLAILLIFFSGLSYSQDVSRYLNITSTEGTHHPFVMIKKDQSAGFEIIRRVSKDYVIIRNSSIFRTEGLEAFEVNDEWKWATEYGENQKGQFYVTAEINPENTFQRLKLISFEPNKNLLIVEGTVKMLRKELLSNPHVTYIQQKAKKPTTESRIREHNLAINNIRYVQNQFPSIDGSSITVSIKEQSFDTIDIDIKGRGVRDLFSNEFVVGHATDMATLVGGAGNSYITGHGVAPKTNLFSTSFENLFPETNSYFTSRDVTVQNHSYGVGIENFYGLESVSFDEQAGSLPNLTHIFSAGNSGSQQGTGQYAGLNRYGTLTGSFKQAKNVILVTSSDEFGNVLTANSAGPTYDGRIKPDISAFGKGGTSDAAAVVSGATALLQEFYFEKNAVQPKTDVIKALLIAGSDDIDTPGPDFFGGYGQLNLKKSMSIIENGWLIEGTISDLELQTHQIDISNSADYLTIVLAWRDPAANNGDALALINDIDLKARLDANEWLPWILDSTPSESNLAAPAITGIDHLNTVEVIQIDNPSLGTYSVDITGFDITGSQDYIIAYYIESSNKFTWTYPTKIDPQQAGETVQLFFDNTYSATGSIEWGDMSDNWTSLGTINPGTHFSSVNLPDVNEDFVLRASFGPDIFKSDTFYLGTTPQIKVALYCDDEMVLYWDKISETTSYELLAYENEALMTKQISSDTFAIIDRNETNSLFFTVRQVGTYTNGLPDETIRVDQQGIRCYLNNFLATLDIFENVNLTVDVSLPEFIETLRIIKVDLEDSVVFQEITPSQNQHSFLDSNLTPGHTGYYAQLVTKNGAEILSDRISLFTTDDRKYILFPNPVTDGFVNLLSPEPNAVFQVLQLDGKPIREYIMGEKFESFELQLPKGTYLYRVLKGVKVLKSGKFVIGS